MANESFEYLQYTQTNIVGMAIYECVCVFPFFHSSATLLNNNNNTKALNHLTKVDNQIFVGAAVDIRMVVAVVVVAVINSSATELIN